MIDELSMQIVIKVYVMKIVNIMDMIMLIKDLYVLVKLNLVFQLYHK